MCTCAFVVWNIGWITTYARGNGEKDIRLNGIDKMGLDIYFNFSEREKEREKKDKHHIWWNVFIYNCRWLGGKYAITKHTHTHRRMNMRVCSAWCLMIPYDITDHGICSVVHSHQMKCFGGISILWNRTLRSCAPFFFSHGIPTTAQSIWLSRSQCLIKWTNV